MRYKLVLIVAAILLLLIVSPVYALVSNNTYALPVEALTNSPADSVTNYIGNAPSLPITTADLNRVYIPTDGNISRIEIYDYSGTAGSNEAWTYYIRINNARDFFINTTSASANMRLFFNMSMNIPINTGDYFEIKRVNPAWGTNPATNIVGGNVFITTNDTGYVLWGQGLVIDPADATTYYIGTKPAAPNSTSAGRAKIYVPAGGNISKAFVVTYAGTAGTNEAWTYEIRDITNPIFIQTVSSATTQRVFSNTSIPPGKASLLAGDYIEFSTTTPSWATNPRRVNTSAIAFINMSNTTDVPGYPFHVQALTSSPADTADVYFGNLPKAPTTTAGISRVYVMENGTLKKVNIYSYSGTTGTNEAWPLNVSVNSTKNYFIQTVSAAASERIWLNDSINIPVYSGDYFEILGNQPNWGTNPATTIYGGWVWFEPYRPIVGDFVGYPSLNGTHPLSVGFLSNNSGSRSDSYYWIFDGVNTSTSQNPSFTYYKPGCWTVSLTYTNVTLGNTTISKPYYINVTYPSVENITFDFVGYPNLNGTRPLSVGFVTNSSGYVADSYYWLFDGVNTSTSQNPSFTYYKSGCWTVSLTITNTTYGNLTATKPYYINVSTFPNVSGDFVGYPNLNGTRPLSVGFVTNTSGSAPDSYYWVFDGVNTSTSQNPSFTYYQAGCWTVNVTLVNASIGNITITKTNYINVSEYTSITGDFVGYPALNGTRPLSVGFVTNTSGSVVDSYYWLFDGINTSTSQNPSFVYSQWGCWTVSVTYVNTTIGNTTVTKSNYINVSILESIDPEFVGNPALNGTTPLSVTFSVASNTTIIDSVYWDFGDGNTSVAATPTFIYRPPGTYSVNHSVTNATIGTFWMNKSSYILVNAMVTPVVADFSGFPTNGYAPLNVGFTDLSTGSPTTWDWDFGDGTVHGNTQNPNHQYDAFGTFDVSLTASKAGSSDTETKVAYITTTEQVVAGFSANVTNGAAPLNVGFTDSSTGNVTDWAWDFGDGNTSLLQNPTHVYAFSGIFDVTLNVSNSDNADTELKLGYITVSAPLPVVADFVGVPTNGYNPLTVTFTDLSTGYPTIWNWSFGDLTYSALQNPSHQYTSFGTYTVSLTIWNGSSTDTMTKIDYITVDSEPLVCDFHGSPTSGAVPLFVQFTDDSTGTPTNWAWNLTDAGPDNDSYAQNPVNVYDIPGSYSVRLECWNTERADNMTRSYYINVTPTGPSAGVIKLAQPRNYVDVFIWILIFIIMMISFGVACLLKGLSKVILSVFALILSLAVVWGSLSISYIDKVDVGTMYSGNNTLSGANGTYLANSTVFNIGIIEVVAHSWITIVAAILMIVMLLMVVHSVMLMLEELDDEKRERAEYKKRNKGFI